MTESNGSALQIENLKKGFAGKSILDISSFTLSKSTPQVLAGESGSGKTTFLNLVAGILTPDSGSIRIDGTELTALSPRGRDAFRGKKIGLVHQTFNLLQGFTALENLLIPLKFGAIPKGERKSRAVELLKRVGLTEHLKKRPAELSVGQQQRVGLARALVNRPALVLCDEPTAQLDQENAGRVLDLLKEICQENEAALLIVAHDEFVFSRFGTVTKLDEINQAT